MYNLKQMFPKLRVTFDASIEIRNDPCMMEIICAKGIIYPHSDELLALECKTYTAKQILLIPGTRIWQQGDSEWTILFRLDLFEKIAEIVKPRKKRVMSETRRAQAIERLRKYQYK